MEHEKVIDALGGPTEVSRSLDMPFQRVRFWWRRSHIPPGYWPEIMNLARRQKVPLTLDQLMHGVRSRAEQREAS